MEGMRTIDPKEIPTNVLHQYILASVAPRPIAFASTVDEAGNRNLAPYSFFNAFSSNPPIFIFSSNRKVKDNTTKDTLHNVQATGEVVINIVNYSMVRQMALTSVEYETGISEFEKAGLTPIPSERVKPFRVKESLMQFECKVKEVLPLGDKGGAGNLIVCEVILFHLNESIFGEEDKIDPQKTDQVARMGRAFYCRAHGENIFRLFQPVNVIGIGFDQLPEKVRNSKLLSAYELGELAAVPALPPQEEVVKKRNDAAIKEIFHRLSNQPEKQWEMLQKYAKQLIEEGEVAEAWKVLLQQL